MSSDTRPCTHCGNHFHYRPQNPSQSYCSKPACQQARKTCWERDKRRHDPDYKSNQRDAQKRWQEKRPSYWKQWRKNNPDYVARNREQQRSRNAKLRNPGLAVDTSTIAKMDVSDALDASSVEIAIPAGVYRLIPVDCKGGCVNLEYRCKISALSDSG